jgi:hypothetical protein
MVTLCKTLGQERWKLMHIEEFTLRQQLIEALSYTGPQFFTSFTVML